MEKAGEPGLFDVNETWFVGWKSTHCTTMSHLRCRSLLITGTIVEAPCTGSVPPSKKSFWISTSNRHLRYMVRSGSPVRSARSTELKTDVHLCGRCELCWIKRQTRTAGVQRFPRYSCFVERLR